MLQIILGNPRVLGASDEIIREYRFEVFQVRERSKVGRKNAYVITERTCKCICMCVVCSVVATVLNFFCAGFLV